MLDSATGKGTIVYSLTGRPSWVSYSPSSRLMVANPSTNTPALAYALRHRATNEGGYAEQAITISVEGVLRPPPPTNVSARGFSGGSIFWEWTQSSPSDHVNGYRLEWRRSGSLFYTGINLGAQATQQLQSGFVRGTWEWRLKATTNSRGYEDSVWVTGSVTV